MRSLGGDIRHDLATMKCDPAAQVCMCFVAVATSITKVTREGNDKVLENLLGCHDF